MVGYKMLKTNSKTGILQSVKLDRLAWGVAATEEAGDRLVRPSSEAACLPVCRYFAYNIAQVRMRSYQQKV